MDVANITVVIITYNRLEKLKKALFFCEKQTILPKYIVVINNNSNDGTKEFLLEWQNKKNNLLRKIVINTEENLGGSGGFYVGEMKALSLDADWILLTDDDAYMKIDYIEKASKYIEENEQINDKISVICGIVFQNNSYYGNRHFIDSKWKFNFKKPVPLDFYKQKVFQIDIFSYVGPIINKQALKEVGLVNKDFFIAQDDTEHSLRLSKYGKILCYPDLIIDHDAENAVYKLSWKNYYSYRNNLYLIKQHFPKHYLWVLFISIIKAVFCIFKGRGCSEVKLRLVAIKDAMFNKLGKHKVYKPGWK